jgi:hypothetical protein
MDRRTSLDRFHANCKWEISVQMICIVSGYRSGRDDRWVWGKHAWGHGHFALFLSLVLGAEPATAADKPAEVAAVVAVMGIDFQFPGDWEVQTDPQQRVLFAAPDSGTLPAVTGVEIPRASRYRLWVRAKDYPNDRPGTRNFTVRVGGQRATKRFGTSGKAGFTWEDGGMFDLPAGPLLLCLEEGRPFARCQGLLLSNDPTFVPEQFVGPGGIAATRAVALTVRPAATQGPAETESAASPSTSPAFKVTSQQPMASLANEHLRLDFLPAERRGKPSIAVRSQVHADGKWIDAGADSAAEGYCAVVAGAATKLRYSSFYPQWAKGTGENLITVAAGGQQATTTPGRWRGALWEAGSVYRLNPRSARADGGGVRITFDPSPAGTLEAQWELPRGQRAASVTLTLLPAAEGQIALGYEMFFRRPSAEVQEVLLPMMWQRHRLPLRPITLPDSSTPTPVALVQPVGDSPQCFALSGEPGEMPFDWPDGRRPHCALALTEAGGKVQPSVWGPVLGTPAAMARPGQPVHLRFRVLAQSGDWYAGYRTVVDDVFQVRDYRSNVRASLTDAVLNMIDLTMDDQASGWWDRAKAWYQIESRNGSTHSAPMMLLSLYRLTGDKAVYRRRALPTLEFMLSRSLAHFSPLPAQGGLYPSGSMKGPVKIFGTSTYAGLWELTGRRTDALAAIGLPNDSIRVTIGYTHSRPFDEWLARYLVTGAKKDLDVACNLADRYVRESVVKPPSAEVPAECFFYIQFVPDWEGLLRLYEITGQKTYLEAAAIGARQLMTGTWTQPPVPDRDVTIHPGGKYSVTPELGWWRGPVKYRLGLPRRPGDMPEKMVPAWIVSNVGLGFEQPTTYNSGGAGRLIFQAAWAPHFLRLYRYTGDPAFLTHARNAVVGRWGNYPGYYITGHTDRPQDPRYPWVGPDVTDLYFHHIVPQLAWMIDYLVSEAEVLSEGRIAFPSLRQHGYAYFDSRIFGHASGKVFDDEAAWLTFRRGLVSVDNRQINYLTGRGPRHLHVILMNQSQTAQQVEVRCNTQTPATEGRLRIGTGQATAIALEGGRAKVGVPPRGLAVLSVPDKATDLPQALPAASRELPKQDGVITLKDAVAETRAAAIQVDPGSWDAYIWSTASPEQAKTATLHYTIGERSQAMVVERYPFEFSVPVSDERQEVSFHLDLAKPDGTVIAGPQGRLKLDH